MPLDPFYLDAIKGFEGYSPSATWDYKQHSNGYGTRALYPGETIDRDTAEQRFSAEVGKAYDYVNGIAPNAPPGVKAALTSLTYNAGPGWMNAGLGEAVRAGDWNAASERFQQYNRAGGAVNQGLVNRRAKEAAWFGSEAPGLNASKMAGAAPSLPPYSWSPQSIAPVANQAPASPGYARPQQDISIDAPPPLQHSDILGILAQGPLMRGLRFSRKA